MLGSFLRACSCIAEKCEEVDQVNKVLVGFPFLNLIVGHCGEKLCATNFLICYCVMVYSGISQSGPQAPQMGHIFAPSHLLANCKLSRAPRGPI